MCRQITQSEPIELSKNGVFYSKGVVIAFSNYLKLNANPTSRLASYCIMADLETLQL